MTVNKLELANQIYMELAMTQYADIRAAMTELENNAEAMLENALGPEAYRVLVETRQAIEDQRAELAQQLEYAEAEAKRGALAAMKSYTCAGYQVIYTPGRVSWDTARLDGYALAHPELLDLRKVGQPSVSIRKVR